MEWLLDEPSVVLVCVTIAAALLIVEIALPTIGIAGTLALVAGGMRTPFLLEKDGPIRLPLSSKILP